CYDPSPQNGTLTCSTGGDCPSGYHCASDRTCWHNGNDPGTDGGTDLSASPNDLMNDLLMNDLVRNDLTTGPSINVSAAELSVHLNKTVTMTASLANLSAGNGGQASFAITAGSGSFGPVTCTAPSAGSSTCNAVYTPTAVGAMTATITSVDDTT